VNAAADTNTVDLAVGSLGAPRLMLTRPI
jgi:hypothetical protein